MVASISPISGAMLSRFNRSRNTMPGSPLFHALSTIRSNTSRARTMRTVSPVCGATSGYSSSLSTASMNASVRPTEMLKLLIWVRSSLHAMNFSTSGWSTRRMPMFAPRRVPPCLMASVAAL